MDPGAEGGGGAESSADNPAAEGQGGGLQRVFHCHQCSRKTFPNAEHIEVCIFTFFFSCNMTYLYGQVCRNVFFVGKPTASQLSLKLSKR